MRALVVAALVLALAVPADAAPFGKSRTVGTTPSDYEYDFMFSADGPGGGVAFFVGGEKIVGTRPVQRLYIVRVEGNGRTHGLTTTRIEGRTPIRSYDGGPPRPYLAVGPGWRMLTTEAKGGDPVFGADFYAVRLAPNGRRVAEQRLGPSSGDGVGGFVNTNARGDAIVRFRDGFMISRSAGRFVRAPAALRLHVGLPVLGDDGSLFDLRPANDGSFGVARSTGRRWSTEQSIVAAAPNQFVGSSHVVTTRRGDALLAYEASSQSSGSRSLTLRWARRGRPFGPPLELASGIDASSGSIEALPGGRFAAGWTTRENEFHVARASGHGRPFREVATWTPPENVDFRSLLPLADGRTIAAWATEDPAGVERDRLMARVIDARGNPGPDQTIAVGPRQGDLLGFELRRIGRNRAALLWTQSGPVVKRVRLALTAAR